MANNQFTKLTKSQTRKIVTYIADESPGMIVRKTLRFVDGNFRAQGWQSTSFSAWKAIKRKGTILVKTGALRRGFNYSNISAGTVRFYNNVPYANVHNRGFNGTVNIKAHSRARYAKSKVMSVNEFNRNGTRKSRTITNKVGEASVKAHTRKVNIVQRQFAPYEGHESQILNNSIARELEREIRKILK